MMRIKTTITSICLALLIPIAAAAKQPVSDACTILVDTHVLTNEPFTITVSATEQYPGQWYDPTVSLDITVPINKELPGEINAYNQSVIQEINSPGGANEATATFVIPVVQNFLNEGTVKILAKIKEPVNRGKSLETYCEATTILVFQ